MKRTRTTQDYEAYIINELSDNLEPISEALFKKLVKALSEAFNLSLTKARKIVTTTLKGLYSGQDALIGY